jgi:hypothetical protein
MAKASRMEYAAHPLCHGKGSLREGIGQFRHRDKTLVDNFSAL